MKQGSGEPRKSSRIAPPSVPPPEALYEQSQKRRRIFKSQIASWAASFIEKLPENRGTLQHLFWGTQKRVCSISAVSKSQRFRGAKLSIGLSEPKWGIVAVPKPGCFKPGCLQFLRRSALLLFFCALRVLRSFCALLRTCVFALLRAFALI